MKHLIDGLITKVEDSILALSIEQEKLSAAKQQYDNLQSMIDKENETLVYLAKLKTGQQCPKIYRSLSNANDFKRKKKLPWLSTVKNYLLEHKKPMYTSAILEDITNKNPDFISMRNKDLRKQVYYIQNLGKNNLSGLLLSKNGKIGLCEWFDENNVIKPEYLQL